MVDPGASGIAAGTTIGDRYRVVRAIDAGGMGAIYEAENTWTKRRVAVKVMHPGGGRSPEFLRRFRREAQAAGKISHENVVEVLDMGEDPNAHGLFIVYEFLEGENLRARMPPGRSLAPAEALDLLLPVLEALVAVHALGLVHRDLKPENIFLARTSRGTVPKLIDFGIAKALSPDADNGLRTATGDLMGTPHYMSPEQVRGDDDVDQRADVWSAGVVLYEALAGARPFRATTAGLFVSEVLNGAPRPLSETAPALPPALARAVHGALLPRAERYAGMSEFIAALRIAQADPTATTTPVAVTTPVVTTTPAATATLAERPRAKRRAVHGRFGVAAAVALLVGAVGWRLLAPPAPRPRAPRPAPVVRAPDPPVPTVAPTPAPAIAVAVDAGTAPPVVASRPPHRAPHSPHASRDAGRASELGFVAE